MKFKWEIFDRFGLAFLFGTRQARIIFLFFMCTITYPKKVVPVINVTWRKAKTKNLITD